MWKSFGRDAAENGLKNWLKLPLDQQLGDDEDLEGDLDEEDLDEDLEQDDLDEYDK